jgi:stalled ribosome alternative rescue factor ArfA
MKARLQQTKRHRHGKGSNRTKMIRARPMVNKDARTRKGHIRDNVWEVESIVKSRKSSHGSREVLIKWKGWPHSANSWEPSTNMVD